jgi:dCTP deaminase
MSLLSYHAIMGLLEKSVVKWAAPENVNATSLDITLGEIVMVELDADPGKDLTVVSLGERTPLNMLEVNIADGIILEPGQFILAQSKEVFNLPSYISAEYKLKSSMARIGLEHLNAGWCDAGWNGSVLTLELKNMTQHHRLFIKAGDKIGQTVFFEHVAVPAHASYSVRGRYNGDTTVKGIKP